MFHLPAAVTLLLSRLVNPFVRGLVLLERPPPCIQFLQHPGRRCLVGGTGQLEGGLPPGRGVKDSVEDRPVACEEVGEGVVGVVGGQVDKPHQPRELDEVVVPCASAVVPEVAQGVSCPADCLGMCRLIHQSLNISQREVVNSRGRRSSTSDTGMKGSRSCVCHSLSGILDDASQPLGEQVEDP